MLQCLEREREGERERERERKTKKKCLYCVYRCTCSPAERHQNRPITYSLVVVEFLEDRDAILQAVPVARVKHLKNSSEILLCEVF